jgi:hypothetical protein
MYKTILYHSHAHLDAPEHNLSTDTPLATFTSLVHLGDEPWLWLSNLTAADDHGRSWHHCYHGPGRPPTS